MNYPPHTSVIAPPDRSLTDIRSVPLLGYGGLVLGWIALLAGISGGGMYSNPPMFLTSWTVCWALSFAATAGSVASCFIRKNRGSRLVATIAMGLSLFGSWFTLDSYFENWGSYPWLVIAGLAAISVGGGLACGLRVVPLASAGFVGFWFYGCLVPPSLKLPATHVANGIACTLVSVDDHGCRFRLSDLEGTDLSRVLDLNRVEVAGQVDPLIQIPEQHAFALTGFAETPKSATVEFSLAPMPHPGHDRSISGLRFRAGPIVLRYR